MTTKPFVFENVPDVEREYLIDYLEAVLSEEVKNLERLSAIPDRALVTFDDDHLDIDKTNKTLEKTPLENACLRVAIAVQQNAVLLDRRQYSHFESYLGSEVEGGKNVLKSFTIPGSELVAICISNTTVLKNILEQKEIQVQSFFRNFHGCIQLDESLLSEAIEKAEKALEDKRIPPKPEYNIDDEDRKNFPGGNSNFSDQNNTENQKNDEKRDSKKFPIRTNDQRPNYVDWKTESNEPLTPVKKPPKIPPKPKIPLKPTPMTTKINTEEKNPRADYLDIGEHIWNLIEGKLNKSDFCSYKYDRRIQILKFRSHDPEACKVAIEDVKADIIEGTPLKIPENMRAMFVDLQKKDFFHSCAEDYFQRFSVQFFIQDNSIFFYGWDVDSIDKTKTEVLQRFMYTDEIDNENGMDISHLRQEKRDLESEFMVSISWTDSQASKVQIQGVYDDISFARQSLEEAMHRYKNREACFEFSADHALYIEKHCQDKLHTLLQNVKVSFSGKKNGKYVIEYMGKMEDINTISKALQEIKGKLKVEFIDLSNDFDTETRELLRKAIIHKKSNSLFGTAQNLFENDTKCCILNEVEQKTLSAQKPERKQFKGESINLKEKQSISVQMSPTLKVDVKPKGNIVEEKAEVLVCPLHESGLMRKLAISKAFMKKDPSLQEKVEKLDFSSSPVQLSKMTSRDGGAPTDIAFVSLSAWEEGMPKDYLQQLITEILLKVSELGAKTVAFPPIGLGIVLRHPADAIAKQFFSAIKEYQVKSSAKATLDIIEVLACNSHLYKKLEAESFKFQSPSLRKRRKSEETEEEKGQECSPPQVTIRIIHGHGDRLLAPLWKEKFISCIVDEDYFLHYMPGHLNRKLEKKMEKLVIVMEKTESEEGELVFKFKGLHEDILTIKAFIADEVHKYVTKLGHILSEHSPPRGTLEFIQYAASIEESAPPYWTHQTMKSLGEDIFREVEVDQETSEAIKTLFLSTYDSSLVGHGNDARSIPKKSTIEFIDVKRIENISKFKPYAQARKQVFEKKLREKELCESLSDISKRSQGLLLEPYLSDSMKKNLCHEINECYLLHGTKPNIVDTIKRNGCDPNVSNEKAMFGRGVYAAECSTKCDQYSDDMQNRLPPGSIHYAFLLRMLLGDIYLCDDSHTTVQSRDCAKLSRPPCKNCLEDRCDCSNTHFYDSVVGEGKWLFREFIVYRDYLCYPEYLISYKRM